MTMQRRLDRWKEQGTISASQHVQLASRAREEPFSLFIELHVLLYIGVLAFVAGLGWTVSTWSAQLGDLLILAGLTALLAGSLGASFYRAPNWSRSEQTLASPLLDYVLYLGCLVWGVELAYLEKRFHLLSGQWDLYLLLTALFFLVLAYRFDNRFVLSLALSSLAGWLGVTISHWSSNLDANYRRYALIYCVLVAAAAVLSRLCNFKRHFFGTYLNIVANVLYCTLLSGVFKQTGYEPWLVALLVAAGVSLGWGISQRQFVFVAYAVIYGYLGVSSLLVRNFNNSTLVLSYFVVTAIAMIALLVKIARTFGRSE